ncbi:MAG: transporter associated domain-containing protein [Phycisphaerae bacterium]
MSGLFWVVLIMAAALSSFFALTSNALRMFRRVQLEEAFGRKHDPRRLEKLEQHLKALRLTSSLCRSLSNLVLVLCVVGLMGQAGGLMKIIGGIAIAGVIIAIFGVAIPHAWASYNGEQILARSFGVLMFFRYAIWPLTKLMEAFDLPIRRLAGVVDEDINLHNEHVRQEIVQAASEGQAEGAVDPDEVEMIESVIELGETHAGEIMTPRTEIFALSIDTAWQQAADQIFKAGHSRVPVYQGDLDHIVGILYAKDLLKYVVGNGAPHDLKDTLRKPFFVPETKLLDDLLREFKARKFHISVVLDEYGGTAGLVTIEDVLEEIVGDISDEYDEAQPAMLKKLSDTSYEIDARLHIDELNDAIGLELSEDEDYDTVAGFIFSQMGYIPREGEMFEAYGARFTVLEASDRRLVRVHIERIGQTESQEG